MTRGIAKNPLLKSQRISQAKKGKSNGRLGMKQTETTKQKIREARARQAPPVPTGFKYEGNITSELHILRMSLQYRLWREAVFERDNYTASRHNLYCKDILKICNSDVILPS